MLLQNLDTIVKVFDNFEFIDNNKLYIAIVCEKLDYTLHDFILENDKRGFFIDDIKHFAKQVFNAEKYLHEKGYI